MSARTFCQSTAGVSAAAGCPAGSVDGRCEWCCIANASARLPEAGYRRISTESSHLRSTNRDLVLNHRSHIPRYKPNAEERGDTPDIRQIRTGCVGADTSGGAPSAGAGVYRDAACGANGRPDSEPVSRRIEIAVAETHIELHVRVVIRLHERRLFALVCRPAVPFDVNGQLRLFVEVEVRLLVFDLRVPMMVGHHHFAAIPIAVPGVR